MTGWVRNSTSRTFSYTPQVLATLHCAAVVGLDVLSAANDGEGHGDAEETSVFGALLVVCLDRRSIDADALRADGITNLMVGGLAK